MWRLHLNPHKFSCFPLDSMDDAFFPDADTSPPMDGGRHITSSKKARTQGDSIETRSIDARVSVLEAHYEHIETDVHEGCRDDVRGIRRSGR